jgi:hypothetical protein
MGASDASGPDGQIPEGMALLRVSVHEPGGDHFLGAATARIEREGASVELQREGGQGGELFTAIVEPGTYNLVVDAENWVAPTRDVVVPPDQVKTASVYLGRDGWPAYRMGESIVPFEPRDELVAVAFEFDPPGPEEANVIAQRLRQQLGLTPFAFDPDAEVPFAAARGSVLLFEVPQDQSGAEVLPRIPPLIQREVRAGIVVDLIPGQVKVLDSQFVVQFRDTFTEEQVDAFLAEAGVENLRPFIQSPRARLIKFPSDDYQVNLRTIEGWITQGQLLHGEPDLPAEMRDGAFPQDDPDDPEYGGQENLTLQRVKETWILLNTRNPQWTRGNPAVCVATLDQGVEFAHNDLGGFLTNGHPQIAVRFDFLLMQPLSAGFSPSDNHGMGVYGIIAALTDNDTDIAGIAPNTEQVVLRRPHLTSTQTYADVLLWTAGFVTGNRARGRPVGWPNEPNPHPADIINCSHAKKGLALSLLVDDAFKLLTTSGRGNKGTVLVYGAGNDTSCMTGTLVYAAHPNTLAVANSKAADNSGHEEHESDSNWGPEMDLCARGTDVRSLDIGNDSQRFGGTSASAPTVSAAAALMLSINPNLSWRDVRDILRRTACQIDLGNTTTSGKWINGFSQRYGFGRLDILDAVTQAETFPP